MKSIVKTLLVIGMLSWVAVGSAQNQEGQPGNQGNSLSKLMAMLGKMTDEQKAYARANWLVAPEAYASQHDHPSSYIISPNPAPDTQKTCECSGCSSAYLLRFYGESVNGVELFNQPTFPCKHSEGAAKLHLFSESTKFHPHIHPHIKCFFVIFLDIPQVIELSVIYQ